MPVYNRDFITQLITAAQLHDVYASDQEMYPAPLTFERLQSWVHAASDFAISFYPHSADTSTTADINRTPLGIIIVLPLLRPHWEDLLIGKIKEIDVDAETMFPPTCYSKATGKSGNSHGGSGVEVGLHVFHVEKFKATGPSKWTSASGASDVVRPRKGFAEIAIEETIDRARSMKTADGEKWDVFGLSALTATEAGKRSFVRMRYTPTGYKEMFVTTNGKDGGNKVVTMMYEYPGTVEEPLRGSNVSDMGSDAVVSEPSEMMVRYLSQHES